MTLILNRKPVFTVILAVFCLLSIWYFTHGPGDAETTISIRFLTNTQNLRLRVSKSKHVCIKGQRIFQEQWLHAQLKQFIRVYDARPVPSNVFGTRVMHQFALWCFIRRLQPKYIIESGIFQGLGTWILRQAAPTARLILMDPDGRSLIYRDQMYDTVYLTADKFVDFQHVNWTTLVEPENTLVFIDDHQNPVRRVLEAKRHGFKHMMFDDNYWLEQGDVTSLKLSCLMTLGAMTIEDMLYKDWVKNSFVQREMTSDDLQQITDVFTNVIENYYEFPMIWNATRTVNTNDDNANFLFNDNNGTAVLRELGLVNLPPSNEIEEYYNIAYVKLK